MKRHAGPTATDNAASPTRLATSLGSIVGLGAASALVLLVLGLAVSVVDQGITDQGSFGVVALRRVQLPPQQLQDTTSDWELPDEASREECDCFRHSDSGACCQRAVIRNHKFGWLLTERLFKPFSGRINRGAIHPGAFPQQDPVQDFRHVAVIRNYSEAIVSGFLYHQSGRECWRTFAGGYRRTENNLDWDPYLNRTKYRDDISPYPARNGRSICRYVADEPEEVAMRVYIAVALEWWYGGLDEYYRMAKERQGRGETRRTLFLCIEDYPDAPRQSLMFYRIMDWLYPGGHNFTVPPGVIDDDPDHGGHATSSNATDRARLLDLVGRLDREVFHSAISTTDSYFGCPGTVRRSR
jgi:hypothetical protein